MGDGPIEIESALPDLCGLDLDALDSLGIPALLRAAERLRQEARSPGNSWAGFSSSAHPAQSTEAGKPAATGPSVEVW